MKLRQIEIFYAVMKAGTVSGAAAALHVSQPNVTRILAHTEQQLGFSLFDRVKGRLTPTQEAVTLLPEAEKIYQQLGQLQTLTSQLRAGCGHLRIGAPPILATSLLSNAIVEYTSNTNHSVDLTTDNRDGLCHSLITNQLDIAIAFGSPISPGVSGQHLSKHNMVALIPNGRFENSTVSLSELTDSGKLILLDRRDPLGQSLQHEVEKCAPDFQPRITVRTYSAAAELVLQGGGVAVVDPWTAKAYGSRLTCKPLVSPIDFSVSLLHAENHPLSSNAMSFVELLTNKHRHSSGV